MIVGIGIDLVEVDRIAGIIARRGERFLQRVFTAGEIAYCGRYREPAQHYAVRFAAKEAFLKALGVGLYGGMGLREIEVQRRQGGRPILALHGSAQKLLQSRAAARVHLTLTHTEGIAAAVVLLEAQDYTQRAARLSHREDTSTLATAAGNVKLEASACNERGNEVMELTLISRSPAETIRIGALIGSGLEGGDIVALVGELGAGKTCLTQGIAQGLGVPDGYRITSPTFTLINEYPGKLELYHMDMYRLGGAAETAEMGMEEYFNGPGVVVVEWAEKIEDILPARTLFVHIAYRDEQQRALRLSGSAQRMLKLVNTLHEGGSRHGADRSKVRWDLSCESGEDRECSAQGDQGEGGGQ